MVDPRKMIVIIQEDDVVLNLYYSGENKKDMQIMGDGGVYVTIPENMLVSIAIELLKMSDNK